ncbi:terminase gpA endonuclease subunit [Stakelama tenebrarum]|uniref:Terminase n=1 Tax=Stakelama tenebrarum TaxID=2711215 RepID=A0A6G6Y557_9SPHN|nr:terminase gpA endonuclease subunit [Sphingosinithalassobacter tenebrarum]QIG79981.1 terminase [Sphingosinithalassobacter tenebrarum]
MTFHYGRFGDAAGAALRKNAVALNKAFAEGLQPPPRLTLSEWAPQWRWFPDDAPIPGRWRNETAPELVEIMDAMSIHDPCEAVSLMKCAQSGGSAVAENFLGYISDLAPNATLVVHPTFQAATAWNAEKLWPMIEATPRLSPDRGGTIRARGLADGSGSTTEKILFARSGGYILLAGANSSAGLRQRTVRFAIEDDLDDFPDDLEKQGSPEGMVDARLRVWASRGLAKRLKISTPRIKGASKIGRAYREGDPRRFYLQCPHCRSRFVPEWADLQWPDGEPELAHLVTPCCETPTEHWQKQEMKLPDGWLSLKIDGADVPRVLTEEAFQGWRARMRPSRKIGFHLPGIISTFLSWSEMASAFLAAQGDVNALKTWTNLIKGEEFELRNDAPDYEALMALREQDWGRGQMPIGPVVTTLGVDVQGDGLYLELVGWGPNKESWQLDARFLPGATDVAGQGAWADLDAYSKRGVTFPGGKTFPIDQECVDAGYHTEAAQAYCAKRARRLAVFGRAGWGLPVLGRGVAVRYEAQGHRAGAASRSADDKAHIVGVNGVKLSWYGYLRATLAAVNAAVSEGGDIKVPVGRVHLSRDTPEDWFEMAVAETITVKMVKGFPDRRWTVMPGRENHYLDCRVYNIAATEKLMLDTLGEADWSAHRAERYAAKDARQGDLLSGVGAAQVAAAAAPQPEPKKASPQSGYIERKDNYL